MVIASVKPKNRHASSVCTGRHLPKMSAASAMNPRPDVMLRVNSDDCPIERYAPPSAASAPDSSTPLYRIFATLSPAASAASGFSPTARSRSPNGVRYRTYHVSGTNANAITMGARGNRCSIGICGVEPDERKNAPLRKPGRPIIRMLMAVPDDDLIGLVADAGDRMNQRDQHAGADGRQQDRSTGCRSHRSSRRP